MPVSDVYYGPPEDEKPIDWRNRQDEFDDKDDDEELEVTPQSTIDMLGFDPREFLKDDE